MTALRIGRSDLIHNTADWRADNERVAITGRLPTKDITFAKALRQQLLGYADNPDETIIPVTWADDPTVDGFYKVTSVAVDVEPGGLRIGYWPYRIDLQRVEQYSRPLIESVLLGALRTNAAGVTNTERPWIAIPYNAKNPGIVGTVVSAHGSINAGLTQYVTATGALNLFSTEKALDHDCQVQYQVAPADFYAGAATFETGSTLHTVIGRQYAQDPTSWRLSNGILRVIPSISGTSLRLSIAAFDGSAWDAAIIFNFQNHGVGEIAGTTPASIAVLRNSVEEVIIRITFSGTTTVGGGTLDLLLRRGARMVYGYLSSAPDSGYQVGIIPNTTVAATTLTGGLRKTTDDGGGNRMVIASPDSITKDLATGEVYRSVTATTMNFAIGFEIPGGSAVANNQAQNLILQYLAADTERMTVVNR